MSKWLPGVLTKARMPTVKTKQCEPKLFGSQTRFVCEARCAGNHTRDSCARDGWMRKRGGGQSCLQITVIWLSTDSRCSKAAEALCAYQRVFWYRGKELRNRWTEKLLTKMHFHRGKGICQNSWRKWMRYPRRLRVPSLNKIAQAAARPSPLWEFRAANCFRDFIVASQNENPRWSGPSYLNRITGTRRSVSKGLYVSVFCTSCMQEDTLGKSEMMLLSKSLMKPSTNLCSQFNIAKLTVFSIWQIIISSKWIWPSFRNEDLHLRDKAIRLSASCHSPWWMTSCRKPNTTSTDFQSQVPELSFRYDIWLSFRNDLWLSFREPSRFYRTAVR